MSNLLKSKFLLGVLVVAVVLVAGVAVSATPAAADCSITSTLRVGSTGSEVVCLQQSLGGLTADGHFGPMTKAAVMSWQAKEGLSADGVFGPKSNAVWMSNAGNSMNFPAGCVSNTGFSTTTGQSCAVNSNLPAGCTSTSGYSPTTGALCSVVSTLPAGCSSTAGFSPTTGQSCSGGSSSSGPLSGGAGSVNISTTSVDTETDIAEGQTQKVFGFRVEADGSDLQMTNVKVALTNGGGTGSSWLSRYVSEVSIWEGSTKVGSVTPDQFSKDGSTYSATIALNNAVVREGSSNRQYFYVGLTALSNIDTGDMTGDSWDMTVSNWRYTDGTGAILTLGQSDSLNNQINFQSLASSGDVKVTVAKASSNPVAQNVEVSETSSTPDVTLLNFTVKAVGTDVSVDAMKFVLTSSGATPTQIASEIALYQGSNRVGELTTLAASTVSNTLNLDETMVIPAGSTYSFALKAKILDVTAGAGNGALFDEGDYMKADLGSLSGIFLDQTGSAITNLSGAVLGDYQTFFSEGINASNFSAVLTTTSDNGDITRQSWAITYTVTAFGSTYYVPKTTARDVTTGGTPTVGAEFGLETSAGASSGKGTLSISALSSNASTVGSAFEIPDGESRTFTATVALTSADDATMDGHAALTVPAFYQIQLTTLRYDDSSGLGSLAADYVPAPSQNFQTGQAQVTI